MTEPEFWAYCESLRKEPDYPGICDRLPREIVVQMGELLLQQETNPKVQTTIMMTLAHQQRSKEALRYLKAYNQMQDDKGMKFFTQLAVEGRRYNSKITNCDLSQEGGI